MTRLPGAALTAAVLTAALILGAGAAARDDASTSDGVPASAAPESADAVTRYPVDIYTHNPELFPVGPDHLLLWLPETDKRGEATGRIRLTAFDLELKRRWQVDVEAGETLRKRPRRLVTETGVFALWRDMKGKELCVDAWGIADGLRTRACAKAKLADAPLSFAVVDDKPWVCGVSGADLVCLIFNMSGNEAFAQPLIKKGAKAIIRLDQSADGRLDTVHRGDPFKSFPDAPPDLTYIGFGRAGDRGTALPLRGDDTRRLRSAHRAPGSPHADPDRDSVVGLFSESGNRPAGIYSSRLGTASVHYLPFTRFPAFNRVLEASPDPAAYRFSEPRWHAFADGFLVVIEASRPETGAVTYAGWPTTSPMAGKAIGPVELLDPRVRVWAQLVDFELDRGRINTHALLLHIDRKGKPVWWKAVGLRAWPSPEAAPWVSVGAGPLAEGADPASAVGHFTSGSPVGIEARAVNTAGLDKLPDLHSELTRAAHLSGNRFVGWRYMLEADKQGAAEHLAVVDMLLLTAPDAPPPQAPDQDDEVVR